ncbi:MAG: site-specific DNA-methyltransferase [Kiritimatiellaeota bacterium]|nr:site-specific DNA-methyltransferase [Kiritimatiellota bacterium]
MPTLEWANRKAAVRAATRAPFRLLEHDPALSFGDPDNENMLIQGDNLEGAKTLMPYFAGRVKCFAIDGPYNTRSAFEHYDDNLEHSTWLSMMYPRLELMRDLLAQDGSIWVCIDDNEAHYLKVIMDEIFGRKNFVANVVWQSKDTPGNNSAEIAETHNHVFAYRKSDAFRPHLLERSEKQIANYSNPDEDPRGPWLGTPLTRVEHRDRDYYPLTNPKGREVYPPKGSSWRRPPDVMKRLASENRIWWGKSGNAEFPMEKKFLSEVKEGVVNQTWWPYEFAGSTRNASAELKKLFEGNKSFDTPKPERLLHRILNIATNPGDIVCDPFLGSGTAAAVAHKMGRRWIGIEMGDHAVTHCAPRLRKVIEGEQGGISDLVNWKGGGGFRFYRLGPAITDDAGRINPAIRFPTLAAHVWFSETHTPLTKMGKSPLLGVHKGTAVYLLYNGILGDKKSNTLTGRVLRDLPRHNGPRVIFSECTSLGDERLHRENIIFKHIPYDIKGR